MILKPSKLGLNLRAIEHRRRFGQSVSVLLSCPIGFDCDQELLSEQALWQFVAQEMSIPFLDAGVLKKVPEFLIHGFVFTGNLPRQAIAARAVFGKCSKTILSFGDRNWIQDKSSEALPFEKMRLTWELAYGGPSCVSNPVGIGCSTDPEQAKKLPNFELPNSRMLSRNAAIIPAGFSALDVQHPQRAALCGTYDEQWLREQSLGFPPDIDWRFFNIAPSDQWMDGPLKGDESYLFDNMHPTKPVIEGSLPGFQARVFANYRIGPRGSNEHKLREVPMQLTTVWFFPHAERAILVFHGLAPTEQADGSDIVHWIGAVDHINKLRAREHFAEVLSKRTNNRRADVYALNDADLVPEQLESTKEQAKGAANGSCGLRAKATYRRAQTEFAAACRDLRARGGDPDAMGLKLPEPETPPSIAELPAYLDKLEQEAEQVRWQSLEKMVTATEELRKQVQEGKVIPKDLIKRGPPTYRAANHIKELEQTFRSVGKPFDRLTLAPKLAQREAIGRLNYLQGAHTQVPALPLKDKQATEARREIEWMLARGVKTLPGWDFTGVDLSYLDLRRVDFSGAWLESANLSNANLSHANLTAAVLAHADLRGLVAIKTKFESANLGRAQLEGAVFDGSNFAGAIFEHCDFTGSRLPNAELNGAQMLEATFGRSDWEEASAHSLIFNKRDLKGMVFVRAQMTTCTFIECDLRGVDFRGADLTGGTFLGCNADGANFAGANLERAMFVQKTTLRKADLSGAILKGANLAECNLTEAKLVRTNLDGANLTMTSMPDIDGRRLSAKGAMLRKASLLRSECSGADFKDAILQYADLRDARLREANFYGSDLARVRLTKDTDLDKTHMKRARIYPRLTPEQQAALP